jgi:hypothetical protein
MTDITIPIWLFAVSAGVPCLSFLGLLFFLLRKIRKPYQEMLAEAPIPEKKEPRSWNRPFHHDLLSLQIDTIFNGLNAIIETERIKINTLLGNGSLGNESVQLQQHQQSRQALQPLGKNKNEIPNIDEQIAILADSGGQPEQIAEATGLSQAEVELAIKMRTTRTSGQHPRLEAVA